MAECTVMLRGAWPCLAVSAVLVSVALCGCGMGSSVVDERDGRCVPPGVSVLIELRSSDLTCREAEAIVFLMSGGPSHGLEVIRGAGGEWTCQGRARANGQTLRICRQGEKFFTVAYI